MSEAKPAPIHLEGGVTITGTEPVIIGFREQSGKDDFFLVVLMYPDISDGRNNLCIVLYSNNQRLWPTGNRQYINVRGGVYLQGIIVLKNEENAEKGTEPGQLLYWGPEDKPTTIIFTTSKQKGTDIEGVVLQSERRPFGQWLTTWSYATAKPFPKELYLQQELDRTKVSEVSKSEAT